MNLHEVIDTAKEHAHETLKAEYPPRVGNVQKGNFAAQAISPLEAAHQTITYSLRESGLTEQFLTPSHKETQHWFYQESLKSLETDPFTQIPYFGELYRQFELAETLIEVRIMECNPLDTNRRTALTHQLVNLAQTWAQVKTPFMDPELAPTFREVLIPLTQQAILNSPRSSWQHVYDMISQRYFINPPTESTLGELLKILRRKAKLRLQDVADAVPAGRRSSGKSVTNQYVALLESGKLLPSESRLLQIAEKLDLTPEQIEVLFEAKKIDEGKKPS